LSRVCCFSLNVIFVAFLGAGGEARALDPNRRASQYLRDRWTTNNGFPGGRVNAITQTQDGYLWLATSNALVRFDGFAFKTFEQLNPASRTLSAFDTLLTDANGHLWMKDESKRLLEYQDHALIDIFSNSVFPDAGIAAFSRTQDGWLVIATTGLNTFRYKNGQIEVSARGDSSQLGFVPQSIAETSDGKIWMGTYEEGLFYEDRGQVKSVKIGIPENKINCLLPVANGGLWIGTDSGLIFWDGTKVSSQTPPKPLDHTQILALAEDRNANIWVGTPDGLYRLIVAKSPSAEAVPDEAGKAITVIFEDRDKNLWIGDSYGLERLRDGAFSTFSMAEGLPPDSNGPVYVDGSNRVWLAGSDGGLYRITNRRVEQVQVQGLTNDTVYSIAGSGDELWLGHRQGGLTKLIPRGRGFAAMTYKHAQGLAQDSVSTVFKSNDGSIWAGTFSGGVSRLRQGKFETFTTADGLGSNSISSVDQGADGALWFGTSSGLSEYVDGHWKTLTERDGLPSDEINTIRMDSSGVLWIGTAQGLAFLASNHVRVASESEPLLHEAVFGVVEGPNGYMWMSTSNHIFKVKRSAVLSGVLNVGDIHKYGPIDGLPGTDGVKGDRSVVTDRQGCVWFSMSRGVSVVNPEDADASDAPAIPHIEGLTVDGNERGMGADMRIPPSPQQITISFVGLSLAVPDRVRYRYRLDGYDHDWSDPIDSRQVVYTKLGPGSYRFHLKAANSDGIWNGSEISIPFQIEPAFWQAWWFQLLSVLVFLMAGWLFYLHRMQQITQRLNLRFEERLAERTRIAQDLHDTLLQGFISSSMLVHVATNEVPQDSNARSLLQRSLELMGQVTQEGRKTLKGLRSTTPKNVDLRQSLTSIPEVCGLHEGPEYQVTSDGPSQPMHPAIRDEIYHIAREAIVNAFRHSQATSIEVRLKFTWRRFHLMVCDNGVGIREVILNQGKDGHWGLQGMRERAQRIGAKLQFMTRELSGTVVELIVPARVAFQPRLRRTFFWLLLGLDRSSGDSKGGRDEAE
jgi:ligand-binding sensor domain-containing protein/signal transduction histidine kinase